MSRMVAAKSSPIRKTRFNRTFGLIEQMNMDGVLPSESILWFCKTRGDKITSATRFGRSRRALSRSANENTSGSWVKQPTAQPVKKSRR